MKKYNNKALMPRLLQPFVLGSVLAFSCISPVFAQDSFEKEVEEKKPMPTPNLTVTFNLNSSVPEAQTAYYAEIVEELLRNIPRRVELYGDNKKMLSDYRNLDHMKVLAYLPTSKEDGLSGERELRYFEVEFYAPKKLPESLAKDMKNVVVRHEGRYEDFLTKISDIKGDAGQSLVNVDKAFDRTESGLRSLSKAQLEAQEKAERAKKRAAAQKAKSQPKAKAQPKPQKSESQQMIKTVSASFFGDAAMASGSDLKKLEKLFQSLKGKKVQKVRVLSQAMENEISRSRLKAVQQLARENGVDVADDKWSTVMVKSPLFQTLKVEVIAQ